jgi:hypothetical protein
MEEKEETEKQVREAFAVLDVDGSGALDMEEFKQVLTTEGDTPLSPAQAQAMFDAVDTNGNGLVELDEFVSWWLSRSAAPAPKDAAPDAAPVNHELVRAQQEIVSLRADIALLKAENASLRARVAESEASLLEAKDAPAQNDNPLPPASTADSTAGGSSTVASGISQASGSGSQPPPSSLDHLAAFLQSGAVDGETGKPTGKTIA